MLEPTGFSPESLKVAESSSSSSAAATPSPAKKPKALYAIYEHAQIQEDEAAEDYNIFDIISPRSSGTSSKQSEASASEIRVLQVKAAAAMAFAKAEEARAALVQAQERSDLKSNASGRSRASRRLRRSPESAIFVVGSPGATSSPMIEGDPAPAVFPPMEIKRVKDDADRSQTLSVENVLALQQRLSKESEGAKPPPIQQRLPGVSSDGKPNPESEFFDEPKEPCGGPPPEEFDIATPVHQEQVVKMKEELNRVMNEVDYFLRSSTEKVAQNMRQEAETWEAGLECQMQSTLQMRTEELCSRSELLRAQFVEAERRLLDKEQFLETQHAASLKVEIAQLEIRLKAADMERQRHARTVEEHATKEADAKARVVQYQELELHHAMQEMELARTHLPVEAHQYEMDSQR